MRKLVLTLAAAVGLALVAGPPLASAKDGDDDRGRPAGGRPFELEIDPELDARFGPRRINATQAADIIVAALPGARVTEAELDEDNGRPIWEMTFVFGRSEGEVDVDATTGAILG
ncbi:MAG TPA: PepSY domain-containing protein [Pilimelia sp.]|nr:PepSY domain-containing protein [Pilimelia sp.]